MSAHSIHLQDKRRNLPKLSVYRIWRKSLRTQERVRLIHGKRAIGVRAIEVLLYFPSCSKKIDFDIPCKRSPHETNYK